MFSLKNKKGFTLIELIITIAILSILALIAVPRISGFRAVGQLRTDQANLRTLNAVSDLYLVSHMNEISSVSVTEEAAAIQLQEDKLVGSFLSSPITAVSEDQFFYWFVNEAGKGRWVYSLYEVAGNPQARYNFASMTLAELNARFGEGGASWLIDSELGLRGQNTNGRDLLFLENGKSNYTISTRFTLDDNSNQRGGLGILFESSISESDRPGEYNDSGYILQFDRGYGNGEIIIRPRTINSDGVSSEGRPIFQSANLLPEKTDSWWTTEKEVTLRVVRNSENQPVISASIKDVATGESISVLENFTHDGITGLDDPASNFTGVRTWSNVGAYIHEMNID